MTLAEESLRALMHLGQPIGGNKPSGEGIRVGEGKDPPFQIFQILKWAVLVDDQIRVIKMAALNLGSSQELKAVSVLAADIGSGTNKSEIYLTFPDEFVHFPVGLPLNQLDFPVHMSCQIIKKLAVVNESLLGRDHGAHGHLSRLDAPTTLLQAEPPQ